MIEHNGDIAKDERITELSDDIPEMPKPSGFPSVINYVKNRYSVMYGDEQHIVREFPENSIEDVSKFPIHK